MKDDMQFANKLVPNTNNWAHEIYRTECGTELRYSNVKSIGIKHIKGHENNFLVVEFYEPVTSGENSVSSVALRPRGGVPDNKITMNWMQKEFSAISKWIDRCLRAELERRDKQ